jgi:NAD(P)-dependent dehydrogenase (short-subunit alcohol dehydrogenase family)
MPAQFERRDMAGRLQGKAAIVTGAGGGIGSATAELFCREGARVLLADIRADIAETKAAALRAEGLDAVACALDLADPASIKAMVEAAVDAFGRLDILDNNAALALPGGGDGAVEPMSVEIWDQVMAVNLRGPMLAAQAAIPHMRRGGGGAIVNICSNSMVGGGDGPTAYAVSKGGLATLTLYLAAQHGQEGIRCNGISPGLIHIAEKSTPQREAFRDLMREHELSTRPGEPGDIARAAVFLASDDSAFVNGQILHVDGGATSHLSHFADLARMKGRVGFT